MASLPPYGKRLLKRMRKGHCPKNGINIFTNWKIPKIISDAITFPPDALPTDFDWRFMAGYEIALINTEGCADYKKLKELAILLVRSGVKSVGLIDPDYPLWWFVPKQEVGDPE